MPISDFDGLINLHVGLLAKFGLWSFKVMKALFAARASILLSKLRFFAICFSAEIIVAAASVEAFL